MASAFTHAAAALALGTAFRRPGPPWRFWVAGAACAALPDLDAIGYYLGVPYESAFGHRGFSHSLFFAALLAIALFAFVRDMRHGDGGKVWIFLFLATASHGVLDAFTDGGGGVAFLAPFDDTRYFMPWRPIEVSPMSVRRFFTARGVTVIVNELAWVWLPAGLFAIIATSIRRRRES